MTGRIGKESESTKSRPFYMVCFFHIHGKTGEKSCKKLNKEIKKFYINQTKTIAEYRFWTIDII